MVAMKSATDNADKMVKALTMQYNRARQSQITTELSEIMGGVEAMKGYRGPGPRPGYDRRSRFTSSEICLSSGSSRPRAYQ